MAQPKKIFFLIIEILCNYFLLQSLIHILHLQDISIWTDYTSRIQWPPKINGACMSSPAVPFSRQPSIARWGTAQPPWGHRGGLCTPAWVGGQEAKSSAEKMPFESDLEDEDGMGESRGEVISSWRNSVKRHQSMWLAHRILGNSVLIPSYHAPWREICFTHMYLYIDPYTWMQIHTYRYSYIHTHMYIRTHTPGCDLLHMTHSAISWSFKLSSIRIFWCWCDPPTWFHSHSGWGLAETDEGDRHSVSSDPLPSSVHICFSTVWVNQWNLLTLAPEGNI